MKKMTQVAAVIAAVKRTLGRKDISYINTRMLLTDEQIADVRKTVTRGIVHGRIRYAKRTRNPKKVRAYVAGMVTNHLRKSRQLNGGITYVARKAA